MKKQQHSQLRRAGPIEYVLMRKPVKNINLRVKADGSILVSANRLVSLAQVDSFVASKAEWILRAKERIAKKAMADPPVESITPEDCYEYLFEVCRFIFPLFRGLIGTQPELKFKTLKSCWGVCHPGRGYITLNSRLADRPLAAIEYVVAHEYAHFLYPNHQREFYALLGSLMPDYQMRRALLK